MMPQVSKLLAICAVLLASCSGPASAESDENTTEISQHEAKKLYVLKCGLCHGPDGKLMLATAPDLSASRLSLNDRIAIITYGKGTMPPQKDVLTGAEIKAIAQYIETFRP